VADTTVPPPYLVDVTVVDPTERGGEEEEESLKWLGTRRVSARSLASSAWLLLRTFVFSGCIIDRGHAFFALLPMDYYQQTHTSDR
jgi:hypothetical protein